MAKRRRACDSDVAGNDESGDGAQCGCGLARPGREIRPPLAARRVPRNGGPPATRSPRHTSDAILKESTETHIDPMATSTGVEVGSWIQVYRIAAISWRAVSRAHGG